MGLAGMWIVGRCPPAGFARCRDSFSELSRQAQYSTQEGFNDAFEKKPQSKNRKDLSKHGPHLP